MIPTGPLKFRGDPGQWLVPDHQQAEDNVNGVVVPSWWVPEGQLLEVECVSINNQEEAPNPFPQHYGIVRVTKLTDGSGRIWSRGIKTCEGFSEPIGGWTFAPGELVLRAGERLAIRTTAMSSTTGFLQLFLDGYWWSANEFDYAKRARLIA